LQPQAPTSTEVDIDYLINNVTPRSSEWLQRNREHVSDARSIRVMKRAHEDAVDYGIAPESDAYFQFVENRMGISESRQQPASAPMQRKASPPAAPVSRSGNGTGSRPNVVRLSSEQQEMAKNLGMTNAEYAAQVVALRKEGKLTH
jgi:hypothetical protein